MTRLLEEIRSISKDAARALESAGFVTDSDIKSLSRIDLNELLPGIEKLQLRKSVFEKIQNTSKKPIDVTLKELRSFIPDEAFKEALTGNGAAVDYRNTLKELKDHVNQIQKFIDAHMAVLEPLHENQDKEVNKTPLEFNFEPVSLPSSSGASSQYGSQVGSQLGHPQQTHGVLDKPHQTSGNAQTWTLVTVMNKTIITGKTLDTHLEVLRQVGSHFVQGEDSFRLQLEEKESVEHCEIIIVFCPVVSRIVTDVESAMRQVPDNKDVILVVMHHAREAKMSSSLRTWSRPKHVVLDVNVFFHDAEGGLLKCKENDDAVSEIQRKLLNYSSKRQKIQISQNHLTSFRASVGDFFDKFFPN